jgi:hypothetical protein
MPCKPPATANLQARPPLTPARSFRDDIVPTDAALVSVQMATGRFYPAGGSAIMAVPISRKPILP